MKLGNHKTLIIFITFIFFNNSLVLAADKIQEIPLINLEELSPTFEEDKDELERIEEDNSILNNNENKPKINSNTKKEKIYINIKALDKISAKTSSIRSTIGKTNFFGPLEIKVLKCQRMEKNDSKDTAAYLQVIDLSKKDNNQVYLFNGWTFTSSPTLQSIDHPIYDLWVTSCENI